MGWWIRRGTLRVAIIQRKVPEGGRKYVHRRGRMYGRGEARGRR